MPRIALDAADIRILSALQNYGQLSKNKLAEIVNLSPSPCWLRLNRLKNAGYIEGYSGKIALKKLGDFTQVVVTVSLSHHRRSDFEQFETYIYDYSEIVECAATGGGMDYVMKVVTVSLSRFQELMDELSDAVPNIDRYLTYIVTREIKSTQPDIKRLLEMNQPQN